MIIPKHRDVTAFLLLASAPPPVDSPFFSSFQAGVHITLPSPVSFLGSGETETMSFTIWADNTAAETGSLVLKVKSDETGDDSWGSVLVNTYFSEALPVLYFSPDHVETGVAYDDTVIECV